MANMLIAGYDETNGPELFFLDYLATLVKIPYAAHGYSSYFALSILDRYYKPDMSQEEAMDLVGKCADELKRRFIVNLSKFKVRLIDRDGIHEKGSLAI